MLHIHHWNLESCLQSRPHILAHSNNPIKYGGADDIDGELYTARNTRGNIAGECDCGESRTFHPFAGGVSLADWEAPADDIMLRTFNENERVTTLA